MTDSQFCVRERRLLFRMRASRLSGRLLFLKFADDAKVTLVGIGFGHFEPNPIPFRLTGLIGLEDGEDRLHAYLGLRSKEYDQE
jgi:hypothetical protein